MVSKLKCEDTLIFLAFGVSFKFSKSFLNKLDLCQIFYKIRYYTIDLIVAKNIIEAKRGSDLFFSGEGERKNISKKIDRRIEARK